MNNISKQLNTKLPGTTSKSQFNYKFFIVTNYTYLFNKISIQLYLRVAIKREKSDRNVQHVWNKETIQEDSLSFWKNSRETPYGLRRSSRELEGNVVTLKKAPFNACCTSPSLNLMPLLQNFFEMHSNLKFHKTFD